jgi:hypothetical protein
LLRPGGGDCIWAMAAKRPLAIGVLETEYFWKRYWRMCELAGLVWAVHYGQLGIDRGSVGHDLVRTGSQFSSDEP